MCGKEDTGAKEHRGKWGRDIEFFFTLLGYAVGYANIWRFPYLCMRNGGGVFLIPYILSLFVAAIPLQFLELSLGQFSSLSPLKVWDMCPLFSGIGWGMYIISYIVTAYYSAIMIWTVYFIQASFHDPVPWSSCNNTWNTDQCMEAYNKSNASSAAISLNSTKTPAEEFFNHRVLEISDGIDDIGGLSWPLVVCNIVAWVVVGLALLKGAKSVGKVVYVTATAPYIFLIILLVRGCTLSGSLDGIIFYLKPDFNRLLTFSVWSEACTQVFFSTGPGWGGLITMASYNKFHYNIYRDAILVPILNSLTSFFAGFVVFSVIGFMAAEKGVSIKEAIESGPGLAFVAYPEALSRLPYPPAWSVCFFIMLFLMGLDTQFMLEETMISGIKDRWPHFLRGNRIIITILVISSHILVSLLFCTRAGGYLFQIMDWYSCIVGVLIFTAAESLIVSYIYGFKRFLQDIKMMLGRTPCWGWKLLWGGATPASILMCAIAYLINFNPPTYGAYKYPDWTWTLGWILAAIPITPIPLIFMYRIIKAEGTLLERLKSSARPKKSWGARLEGEMVHMNGSFVDQDTLVPQVEKGQVIEDNAV